MLGRIAEEVAGAAARSVRFPRSAHSRNSITYLRLLTSVQRDRTWGGYQLDGPVHRPGTLIPETDIPAHGLALECAGTEAGGRGHNRASTLYILWLYDRSTGDWRELARSAAVTRDWTLDLGPVAERELHPPRPVLVDLDASARRIMEALERELRPLEDLARVLVVRRVQDRLAAGVAG